jgi:hypothetical protein
LVWPPTPSLKRTSVGVVVAADGGKDGDDDSNSDDPDDNVVANDGGIANGIGCTSDTKRGPLKRWRASAENNVDDDDDDDDDNGMAVDMLRVRDGDDDDDDCGGVRGRMSPAPTVAAIVGAAVALTGVVGRCASGEVVGGRGRTSGGGSGGTVPGEDWVSVRAALRGGGGGVFGSAAAGATT